MATPKIRQATAASSSTLAPSLPRNLSSPACTLSLQPSSALSPVTRDALYSLFDSNMRGISAESSMAYTESGKRAEMQDSTARYLLARRTMPGALDGGELLGFAAFRFDTEETRGSQDAEVIYCYEIHVVPAARGTGLADVLMGELEDIGRRRGMSKSMLTVLKSNAGAIRFYERRGYTPDEIDPTRMADEEEWEDVGEDGEGEPAADYVIMSKALR